MAEAAAYGFQHWLFFEATRLGLAPRSAYGYFQMRPEERGDIQMPPDLGRGGKTRLLRRMGFEAPQQFYRYLQPDSPIPTKQILRRIAEALDLSWPVAALMAGYVDELFIIAQALVSLGLNWAKADGLTYEAGVGIRLLEEMAFPEDRYVVINGYDAELNKAPRMFKQRFAIPNPAAAAIILVRARFPLVWEAPRRNGYWQSILHGIPPLISLAESILSQTPGRKPLHPLFRRALDVLRDKVALRRRHWIAGEYLELWAREISAPFADYASFALYQQPGVGSFVPEPDVRELPTAEELVRGFEITKSS